MNADAWTVANPCVCPICRCESCEDHLPGRLTAFTLAELAAHTFPARKPLLCRRETAVFRAGHLGEVYAERGIGKTWLLQTLALVASQGTEALGFSCPMPCRVLYVDGEMESEEVQERFVLLCNRLKVPLTVPLTDDRLTIIAADWQRDYLPRVDTLEGQTGLEPFVAPADLIIFDNRSCLFDPEGEKDPTAWQPAQLYLLGLRRRGKAVLLAHHSNRQGGARGHSRPEDPMNLLIKLTRPDDYVQAQGARFLVTFDKHRGFHGPAATSFDARLTCDGWHIEGVDGSERDHTARKLREYLVVAHAANDRPKSANTAIARAGVNRNKALEIWAAMLKRGELAKHPDGGFYVA